MRSAIPLLLLLGLSGCGSFLSATTGDVAGIAGGGIASAVTKSPAVATGIGLGVGSAANAGLAYAERRVHRTEQDRIAAAAGGLEPGQVAPWRVVHSIPIEPDEHGEVTVTSETGGAIRCKAIIFSVAEETDGKPDPSFYTASVCGNGTVWRWALAEPATERWGSLQ